MQRRLIILFLMSLLFGSAGFAQQNPYGGTPRPIPGIIEGEDYDTGGEGVGYHDVDAGNNGGQYRSDDVDIETCGEGGFNVGWMDAGDWLEYTVNVAEKGHYTIRVRAASDDADGGAFHVSFRSQKVTSTTTVPYTGGWQVYQWIEIPDVTLTAGQQVMRFTVESSYLNLNYIEFVRGIDAQRPVVSMVYPREGGESEVGVPVILRAEASDPDGTVQKVAFYLNNLSFAVDDQPPFETVWSPGLTGSYSIYAKATDDRGATSTSDTVHFDVRAVKLPAGPDFSPPRGFYDSAFDVTVTGDSSGAVIRYTLDGSDPRTNTAAFESPSPAKIRIDPASTTGRAATPAVTVRACVLKNGRPISDVTAHTYIFIDQVRTQKYPGGEWPQGRVNRESLDYDMDQNVVNDPRYKNSMNDALLDIPSFAVNTDLGSLFDPDSGIYVNPTQRGRDWERAASIELMDPKGREAGFQINAGIRIRGGYSRIGDQPKHAFRLYFRNEYGEGKLNYPLFQDEGVSAFDCVDLRTAQNYSWSYFGSHVGIFIRDVFSRDCQRDMGQPYTRSRAYHLYLNGMYWGLFQTQERSEASYAESYFGGDKNDYDVVKVDPINGMNIEATDGNLEAYQSLWSYSMAGFGSNAAYFKVQGRNADGSVNWDYPVLANPENLIDYLLIIYFTGNFDSPVTAFGGNGAPNNFFGIYNRVGRTGFLFFAHDAEHSLMDPRYSENGDYGYDRTGPYPAGDQMRHFNPQWLHQKLSENAEYRMLFADRIYKHLFNRGALTLDAVLSRFQARADEISLAVVAESARWGDSKTHPPRTRDDDWLPSVEWVKEQFFPDRGDIVVGQLMDDNLYPSIAPPVFKNASQNILDDALTLAPGSKIRLVNPNTGGAGSIFYTLDGTDPRQIGGILNPAALDGGDDREITVTSNTVLKARVKNGGVWSALHEILMNTGQELKGLRITEIHYNPLADGVIGGSEFEFIELKNVGASALPLAGSRFVNGVDYGFSDDATVPAGGFVVLASNSGMFQKRYGFGPTGEYGGQLDNGGERLTLVDASGDTLISVRYNDRFPWPEEADSAGYSLVSRNSNGQGDADTPDYWRSSNLLNGSPGSDDQSSGVEEGGDGTAVSFTLDQNYPNPFNPRTEISFSVPRGSMVRLSVYDMLGREAARLAEGHYEAGTYRVIWDASSFPAGIYVSRLESGAVRISRKLILVK